MERYYLWHYAKLKDLNGRSGEFYNNIEELKRVAFLKSNLELKKRIK